jgi:glycosyltransferase involved in cell wall biosynthesis
MKIALVVPGGFERPGGPEPPRRIPALHALVARLVAHHEVHVVCTDFDDHGGTWPFLGATVHDPGRVPPRGVPLARSAERTWRLLSVLRRASEHACFDVVHAFWVDGNGLAATVASRSLRVPLIASVGGGECVSLPDIGYGNARTLGGRLTAKAVFAGARVVTAGSREARQAIPCKRVEVVPLGADRALFDGPLDRAPGPPFRLVHVASRNAVKDPDTLLAMLHKLVVDRGLDVQLAWLGGDTLQGAVERKARALGLAERIDFRGDQPSSEVRRSLLSAHVHLVSSRHESQCVAVLEAALAGVPTVGTGVGLVADLAPRAAVAVPVSDADALAEGVATLLASPPRRWAVAEAAQGYARLHDADWTASTFVSLYRRVSEELSRPR